MATPLPKLRHAERTHVGKVRKNNEDNYAELPDKGLYLVCDGMGGYEGGEVASRLAVSTVVEFYGQAVEKGHEMTWPGNYDAALPLRTNCLKAGIEIANQRILDAIAETPKLEKMGTTAVGLVFDEGKAWFCHVGDSRGYRWRGGVLTQVTCDHSWVGEQLRMGIITAEEAEHHQFKNVITRSLGMAETPKVDVTPDAPEPGDIYLLCSDGLSGFASDEKINAILTAAPGDLERAADQLIEAALDGGGKDNVTLILVGYDGA